jgi:hypothetical protein
MTNNIEQLVKNLNDAEELSTRDLSEVEPKYLMGIQTAKRMAQQEVVAYTKTFKDLASASVFKVLLTGNKKVVARFVNACKDEGLFIIDGEALYRRLASEVEKTLGASREFTSNQLAYLIKSVTEIGREEDLSDVAIPRVNPSVYGRPLEGFDDLVEVVRDAVRGSDNDDLNALLVERTALNAITKARWYASAIPVAITSLSRDEAKNIGEKAFKGRPSVKVDITSVVAESDEDFVKAVGNRILDAYAKVAKKA